MFSGLTEQLMPLRQRLLKPFQLSRLAVEIEDDHLSLLEFQPGPGDLLVRQWLTTPLPAGVFSAGVPLLPDALGDLLGDLLLGGGIKAPGALACLPPAGVSLRLLGLPPQLAGAELRALLHGREASLGLPFPLGEAELDGELKEGGMLGAFMASEAIDRWIQTFTVAGLELHGLEPATMSMGRALAEAFKAFGSDDWLGVLDLQAQRWDLVLWLAGLPRLQLSFDPHTGLERIQRLLALARSEGLLAPRGGLAQLWLVGPGADDPLLVSHCRERFAWGVALGDPQAVAGVSWSESWQEPATASLSRLLGLALGGAKP
ncbi:MAG: hypothetical protein RLZZ158_1879 [Cyanobacteriota bacterium]